MQLFGIIVLKMGKIFEIYAVILALIAKKIIVPNSHVVHTF
ncbi:hypothetical protein CRENPOLYSF1_1140029 [Crenothrix polyspora]|uniref:Uncharacterized protein n=1 Tax=Crenothrix polyspora TaxID=360316 RepID=A0A1R4H058_9GAMM|nr:hypothetical protein CRENPOLYSF1_1140029 [Crenothrix polyspora]